MFYLETVFVRQERYLVVPISRSGSTTEVMMTQKVAAELAAPSDYLFEVGSGLPDFARSILQLLPVHFLAYHKLLAVGLSPAVPVSLSYWVEATRL